MAKINFLVIIAFSILFVLIVNAAEEGIDESYNKTNEIPDLSYSNDTATNNSYGLNNTETIADNKPIEVNNSAENASQNNLNSTNETKTINDTDYLNGTPEANNANLNNALTAESNDTGIEENQNAANEIAAEVSEDLTADALTNAAYGEETDYGKESDVSVTAGFGVYLEIVG